MQLQTSEVARLLDMEPWQVQSYAKQGFVKSVKPPAGAGTRRIYDAIGIFKLAILNQLNLDGMDIRKIRNIFENLFEFPSTDEVSPVKSIYSVFSEKVLITAKQFSVRKLVRKDRLTSVIEELQVDHPGLYIIDVGSIVSLLLDKELS
jgi:DNA-binding transcriptional MerR regulator